MSWDFWEEVAQWGLIGYLLFYRRYAVTWFPVKEQESTQEPETPPQTWENPL